MGLQKQRPAKQRKIRRNKQQRQIRRRGGKTEVRVRRWILKFRGFFEFFCFTRYLFSSQNPVFIPICPKWLRYSRYLNRNETRAFLYRPKHRYSKFRRYRSVRYEINFLDPSAFWGYPCGFQNAGIAPFFVVSKQNSKPRSKCNWNARSELIEKFGT